MDTEIELTTPEVNLMRVRNRLLAILCVLWFAAPASAATIDYSAPPGNNYDKADFRLWFPDDAGRIRAIVVLVPGSNGDGRPMAADEFWQKFAAERHLALVACRFTDKKHDQSFIEEYVNVLQGSGQALLDALREFATQSKHPEIAGAPIMLWGMSAGGEFDYEFTAWKPERVIAFVVNKGNIYYTALAPAAARAVPGLLFTGEKDLEFRTNTIVGLFAVNRRAGALWALTQEPGLGHEVGRSKDLGAMLFDAVLPLRLPETGATADGTVALRALSDKDGFYGDPGDHTIAPVASAKPPSKPVAWLPTERLAKAWLAVVTGKAFD